MKTETIKAEKSGGIPKRKQSEKKSLNIFLKSLTDSWNNYVQSRLKKTQLMTKFFLIEIRDAAQEIVFQFNPRQMKITL